MYIRTLTHNTYKRMGGIALILTKEYADLTIIWRPCCASSGIWFC